jgi:hypothetical protein
VILQYRATKGKLSESAVTQLRKLFNENKNPDHRMRAMWALHITKNFTEDELLKTLSDKDEYVRAWSIQMLCEDMNASAKAVDTMVKMSYSDPSAVVRLYLAAALQRVDVKSKWLIGEGLISQSKDIEDHNIPKMIWYGIEELVEQAPEKAITMTGSCKLPMIAEFTSRRLVDANALSLLVAELGKNTNQVSAMLKGMVAGLEGRSDVQAPNNWEAVYHKLESNKEVAPLAQEIAQLFGDKEATQKFLAQLKNK